MKPDRELLELAAKAAGYFIKWGSYIVCDDPVDCRDIPYVKTHQYDEAEWYWNPLEDDGDALRLAVRLGLDIITRRVNGGAYAGTPNHSADAYAEADDPYAATRRAIVRAAAAIGKDMK